MDNVKDAFQKVKEDMDSLKKEIEFLRENLTETREKLVEISHIMLKLNERIPPTQDPSNQSSPTQTPTHQHIFKPLKPQNLGISTGNQGVPTDTPTDTPTHQQTQNMPKKQAKTDIDNAVEILDSLDNIKKEIRLKFKRLTEQELLVFSTIYQLDDQQKEIDHKILSDLLKLSESSIRDYVGRLIKKGIPVVKKRINNKTIRISISSNLKKIAPLSTILQLRDL